MYVCMSGIIPWEFPSVVKKGMGDGTSIFWLLFFTPVLEVSPKATTTYAPVGDRMKRHLLAWKWSDVLYPSHLGSGLNKEHNERLSVGHPEHV